MTRIRILLSLIPMACLGLFASALPEAQKLDYDRDIRPILSENCFKCHGFDAGQRQAGLRLDLSEGAYAKLAGGNRAVVPGDLKASALVKRTGDRSMPPVYSGKKLSDAQIATLRRWV